MMAGSKNARILLVEGENDKRVFPQLLEKAGIPWPKSDPPVDIKPFGGIEELLKPAVLETYLKSSDLGFLGIIFDADVDPNQQWSRFRARIKEHVSDFPPSPEVGGTVCEAENNVRIGVWMMPDNSRSGMLETFLSYLIPEESFALKEFAFACTNNAKDHGAPYREVHLDKARIHAWLAWQDPPGQQMHLAIMSKQIASDGALAKDFLSWFRQTYQFDRL